MDYFSSCMFGNKPAIFTLINLLINFSSIHQVKLLGIGGDLLIGTWKNCCLLNSKQVYNMLLNSVLMIMTHHSGWWTGYDGPHIFHIHCLEQGWWPKRRRRRRRRRRHPLYGRQSRRSKKNHGKVQVTNFLIPGTYGKGMGHAWGRSKCLMLF